MTYLQELRERERKRDEQKRQTEGESVEGHAENENAEAPITSISDLDSIFSKQRPTEFLISPELPARSLVMLAGESEAGKTTLACSWARDLVRKGHAVLILDRDGNPRERIVDRFLRLGVTADEPLLRVWDCQQRDEPPLPDAEIVQQWVRDMIAKTGLSPLVIIDSLVSNIADGESENTSTDMRRAVVRCRRLTRLGATVVILHHTGHNLRRSRELTHLCSPNLTQAA